MLPLCLAALGMVMMTSPARAQTPEEVLLNLESIKLEMERIRQETNRLGLLTQVEIQRELDLLRLEMERAKREFEMELARFKGVAKKENEEIFQVVEKFRVTVEKLFEEIQQRLKQYQQESRALHAEAKEAAEPVDGEGPETLKLAAAQFRRETGNSRGPVEPEALKLPRVKTLSPDKPLELESVETEVPSARDQKSKDISYEPKLFYIPRPGESPSAPDSDLDPYLKKMENHTARIRQVKAKLGREQDNPRPLWLNLGQAYLSSERFLRTVPAEAAGRILKSDVVTTLILGGYQAALLAFKTALWINPEDPDTNIVVSTIYDEMEDGQNAVNYLERARVLYQGQDKSVQARAAEIKLQALMRKYPDTWICSARSSEDCEQNAGRVSVGGELFQENMEFYQAGVPPVPAP